MGRGETEAFVWTSQSYSRVMENKGSETIVARRMKLGFLIPILTTSLMIPKVPRKLILSMELLGLDKVNIPQMDPYIECSKS